MKFNLLTKSSSGLINLQCHSLEDLRHARIIFCLHTTGFSNSLKNSIDYFIQKQGIDGGWNCIETTAWITSIVKMFNSPEVNHSNRILHSLEWLNNNRTIETGWGRSPRDMARIPVTGWVLTLLPELADEKSLSWLENEWKKDLNSETKLTYKGALTLMAFAATKANPKDASLIPETVEYLMSEQNEDGGFAPWKRHPVGSEPWSTGIDLLGLTAFPDLVKPEVVERTLEWLGRNQLPNGLWPCHYIEEGSAYCYWGAVEGMKYLKRIGRL